MDSSGYQQQLTASREATVQYRPFFHAKRPNCGAQDTALNPAYTVGENTDICGHLRKDSIIEEEINNSRPDGRVNIFAVH